MQTLIIEILHFKKNSKPSTDHHKLTKPKIKFDKLKDINLKIIILSRIDSKKISGSYGCNIKAVFLILK